MIPLSERTLDGMVRMYELTLDSNAFLYQKTFQETALGRTITYTRIQDSEDVDLPSFKIRIDPIIVDEQMKNAAIEIPNEVKISIQTTAPILKAEDKISVIDESEDEIDSYLILGAAENRSGTTFDRMYKAVKQ